MAQVVAFLETRRSMSNGIVALRGLGHESSEICGPQDVRLRSQERVLWDPLEHQRVTSLACRSVDALMPALKSFRGSGRRKEQ